MGKPTLEEWIKETDELCKTKTGCDWADLCGDRAPLESAFGDGLTPLEFVDGEIRRHGLEDLTGMSDGEFDFDE